MHVLILPSWYATVDKPWSGAFFRDQAVALARAGAQVGVVYVEDRSLRRLTIPRILTSRFQKDFSESDGVVTLRLKGWNTLRQTFPGARVWCALTKRLIRAYVKTCGIPDVLHAHSALWAGRAAVDAAVGLDRPCIVTEHLSLVLTGQLDADTRREAVTTYRRADAVLAVSPPLLASVRELTGREVGQVLPNMVDTEFFTLPPRPRRREPFTFLSVSNLVESKRLDVLIRAFHRAFSAETDVRLVIAGAGQERKRLMDLTASLLISKKVEFTGALTRAEVRNRLWSANALCLPSSHETFGVVIIEALATGLPVLSTRCGGPEHTVTNDVGILVKPDDEQDLSRGLRQMLTRFYDEQKLRDYTTSRFSFGSVCSQLGQLYTSVMSNRG